MVWATKRKYTCFCQDAFLSYVFREAACHAIVKIKTVQPYKRRSRGNHPKGPSAIVELETSTLARLPQQRHHEKIQLAVPLVSAAVGAERAATATDTATYMYKELLCVI